MLPQIRLSILTELGLATVLGWLILARVDRLGLDGTSIFFGVMLASWWMVRTSAILSRSAGAWLK